MSDPTLLLSSTAFRAFIVLILVATIFWLWMLIDAIKRGGILWPLFVFFLGWIGALVYFFAVKRVHPAEYKPEYKPPIAPVRGGEQIEAEYGELEISNGTELDAFAVLIPGKRSVHVRSHDTVTLREDPWRDLSALLTLGKKWDGRANKFLIDLIYKRFEDPLKFHTKRDPFGGSVQYSKISITLHGVIGGQARTESVTEEEFLNLVR